MCHIPGISAISALPLALVFTAMTHSAAAQAAGPEREAPPAPTSPRTVAFPRPQERTLPNGVRVIVVERASSPLVALRLAVTAGAAADPRELPGLAAMVAELLARGSATRGAPAIADAAEAIGGTLHTSSGWDGSQADLTVRPEHLEAALRLLAEAVRQPAFQAEEIERLRREKLDELQVNLSQPRFLAAAAAAKLAFGDRPYGHLLGGSEASLQRMSRAAIVNFHAERYRPDQAILILAGDVRAEHGFALARAAVGDWQAPAKPAATAAAPPPAWPAPRVVVLDQPDAAQASVFLVRPGIRRSDPAAYRGALANTVLGGAYSARLNQEVRIKRGLSYGARSALEARREIGPFLMSAQTKNSSAPEVAALLVSELQRLARDPIPDAELAPRKANLLGNFARRLETSEGLRDFVAELALVGLALDEANRFTGSVQAVTGEDARQFAAAQLAAEGASLVVAGNGAEFLEALRASFPQVEVVPVVELDLDSVTLRRPSPVPTGH